MAQAISDLTASNSPSKNIAIPFTTIYGIFTVIFSIYFFVYFKQKINKFVTFGAGIFCIMPIVSSLGYTFFPLSEPGFAGTFQDKMHMVVTIIVVLFTIIALISFIIGLFRTEKLKYLGIISLCTFLLLLTGSMLINILPKEYFGIAERINVYSIVIYTGILSFWMHKYIKNNGVHQLIA
jgi:heme/copper-type cytochrome/quinol oxidase subunit 4